MSQIMYFYVRKFLKKVLSFSQIKFCYLMLIKNNFYHFNDYSLSTFYLNIFSDAKVDLLEIFSS
jgi:hypothetical protein